MRRLRRSASATLGLAAAGALLAACSGSGDPTSTPTSPPVSPPVSSPVSSTSSPPTSSSPTESPTESSTESSTGGAGLPAGGTAAAPVVLQPRTDLLTWHDAGSPDSTTVTRTPTGGISLDRSLGTATLTDARGSYRIQAGAGYRFSDVVSDGRYAVVVAQQKLQEKPGRATVVTLHDRTQRTLTGASAPATVNGGAWAIGGGRIYHATYRGRSYCLASVALSDLRGQVTYCAPARSGFSDVHVSDAGVSLVTFGGQPQCRVVGSLAGSALSPFAGVARCGGWDSAVTGDGAVWSSVPNPHVADAARFFARVGPSYYSLGAGTTRSLVWCGGSAYFTRDAQRDRGKALLLRWSPASGLSVVYRSPGLGQAFLDPPRCAGDVLTLSEFGQGGDQQVWATTRASAG